MAGTTNVQLEYALRDLPTFRGVYAANQLPDTSNWPPGSCCIFNYSPIGTGVPGSHWTLAGNVGSHGVMVGGVGTAKGHLPVPFWFDSYGMAPDAMVPILKVPPTHFREWMELQSRKQGHKGLFYSSKIDLQCTGAETHDPSDVCGEMCVLAARWNTPIDPVTGKIRHQWRKVLSFKDQCWQTQRLVRRYAHVR